MVLGFGLVLQMDLQTVVEVELVLGECFALALVLGLVELVLVAMRCCLQMDCILCFVVVVWYSLDLCFAVVAGLA